MAWPLLQPEVTVCLSNIQGNVHHIKHPVRSVLGVRDQITIRRHPTDSPHFKNLLIYGQPLGSCCVAWAF